MDLSRTGTLEMPCACPGTPHAQDLITIRTDLSGTEWADALQFGADRYLGISIVAWNLVDEAGKDVPLTEQTIAMLDYPTVAAINAWTAQHVNIPSLPNASAAPSPNTPPAGPSRTPKARKGGSPTTSSSAPAAGAETSSASPVTSS